jgi:hypothetical protein
MLMGEPVVVLTGRHERSLKIFDREGSPIGVADLSDKYSYTFSDAEPRFAITPPRTPSRFERLTSRPAIKPTDLTFKLTTTDGLELTVPITSDGPIRQGDDIIATARSCKRGEFVGRASRWSGINAWRIVDRSDAELARITFLRQRDLRYALNATIFFGHREDRVNYVVHMAPIAKDVDRAAAIALAVIIDITVIDFEHLRSEWEIEVG